MQTERREAEMREEGNTACPSCHAVLVAGMRFCRMCGYRLGEGVEEYAATQRFDTPPTAAAQTPPATDPFAPRTPWGAQPIQPASAVPPPAPFAPIGGPAAWNTTTGGNTKHAGWW